MSISAQESQSGGFLAQCKALGQQPLYAIAVCWFDSQSQAYM